MMKAKLKVAIVAPPFGETGGPEVVSKNLAHALKAAGADVTLFAPGDWKTEVRHVATLEKSIWNMSAAEKKGKIEDLRIESQKKVIEYANNFDVIHFHCQRYSQFAAKEISKKCVLTLHNNLSEKGFTELKKTGMKLVAVSNAQNKKNLADTVIYNGLPMKNVAFSDAEGEYLLFLGRLTDQKGIDLAIEIAVKAQKKLNIIGRIGNTKDRKEYFDKKLKPFIDGKQICYLGTVEHEKIYEYCAKAAALLFPIRRPETFGLVAVEALASGTPVIGTLVDPLPEILKNSKICVLSNDIEVLVDAAKNTSSFDRKVCRKYAEENFDSTIMAKNYLEFYEKILKEK